MKKIFIPLVALCTAYVCFAQVKVNNLGNTGMGNDPLPDTRLHLYSSTPAANSYGLQSFLENTDSPSSSLHGAYFKNKQSGPIYSSGSMDGIIIDNEGGMYANYTSGVRVNNLCNGYAGSSYGFHVKNIGSGYSKSFYGLYAENVTGSAFGSIYGSYLSNKRTGSSGDMYGVYSINTDSTNSSAGAGTFGAYLSATSVNRSNGVYGVYSTVSGTSTRVFSGYFTGSKFVVMNGNVGIGRENPAYLLDVNGTIRVASTLYSSDERLKSDIKPLTDEKDKLYLLQGKSYKKALLPVDIKDSLTLAVAKKTKEKVIETPEYGYLAQELKEVFPDLVSQDSAGYYSVNYIGLIPVIIEALKDQRSENEKQQIQIEEQREQIKQLVKLLDIKSIDKKAFEANGIESIPLLLQNTPNPFNQTTEIGYFIPETVGSANIYIYDVNGVQQRNISIAERGQGITVLQATALQAGIYFYTLICDGKPVDTKQMILTR